MGALTQVLKSGDLISGLPSYFCRAWVNFNGTGTVAIRASGNVSSITDKGVGDYAVNFSNTMPDNNYSAVVTPGSDGLNALTPIVSGFTTSEVTVSLARNLTSGLNDSSIVCMSIYR